MDSDNVIYDAAIIGGGISGLGVATELLQNGLSVLLLEKSQISEATSANSLRIIHGGFRYLQNFDLFRVIESLQDQGSLLKDYPEHLVVLPCLLPVQRSGLKSRWPMVCGAILYNLFSKVFTGCSNGAAVISAAELGNRRPSFFAPSVRLLRWNDVILRDPIKFAKAIRDSISAQGGLVYENAFVNEVRIENRGYRLNVESEQGALSYLARSVVNTAGPWLHRIPTAFKAMTAYPAGWCKAFNIILKSQFEVNYGVGIWGPQKRSFFLVPRDSQSVLGTWYQPYYGDPGKAAVTKDDLSEFIDCFNQSSFDLKISGSDVEDYEMGVLPMKKVSSVGPVLYGMEKIFSNNGYVQVLSTKYTTFRSQARKVYRSLS